VSLVKKIPAVKAQIALSDRPEYGVQPTAVSRGKSSDRNATVEILRYLGAVGIVWFHLGGTHSQFGYSALVLFIVLSVYFGMGRTTSAWARTEPLLIWLFWSTIYFAMKIVQMVMLNEPIVSELEPWMLLTGPVLPLWFLPFIYVANGVAWNYEKHFKISVAWIEGLTLALGVVGAISLLKLAPGIPFAQWCVGASAVFLAIAVFRAREHRLPLMMVMVTICTGYLAGPESDYLLLLFAGPISAVALLYGPVWHSALATKIGALALPVYLLHPGVFAILLMALPDIAPLPRIFMVVVASTLLGMLLQRIPFFRRFV
jgi:hypothetical protein